MDSISVWASTDSASLDATFRPKLALQWEQIGPGHVLCLMNLVPGLTSSVRNHLTPRLYPKVCGRTWGFIRGKYGPL